MAAPSFVANGTVQALTTSASVPYPAGLVAGDLILLYAANTATGIQNAPAGWTELGSLTTSGSATSRIWYRIATGTESGTVAITVTSGLKGAAWTVAYRPAVAGGILSGTLTVTRGADTTSANTSYSATGSSWTTQADDRIAAFTLAPGVGTFTGASTGRAISQSGQTDTDSNRFNAGTSTNTVDYGLDDAAVTVGSTGAPVYVMTTVGTNATGQTTFVLIRESPAPLIPLTTVTRVASYRAATR